MEELNYFNSQQEENKLDLTELEDATSAAFTVSDPVVQNNIPMYTVKGTDNDGDFETTRRFSEFVALREVLIQQWPGCYVPFLPEKTYSRPNDKHAIEERRELLQRFLRELAQFNFIIGSPEFKVFARTTGEITATLKAMKPETPKVILEKYRSNFPAVNDDVNPMVIAGYKEKINVFMIFLRKALVQLEVSHQSSYSDLIKDH